MYCFWNVASEYYIALFLSLSLSFATLPTPFSVLDVYVLSTDGQVQDFRFPQTNKGGASLQLSSNTVKVNSKNGKKNIAAETFNHGEVWLFQQLTGDIKSPPDGDVNCRSCNKNEGGQVDYMFKGKVCNFGNYA